MPNRNKAYLDRLRTRLLMERGNSCSVCKGLSCGNIRLEFAHIKPTSINGSSRGLSKRLLDIQSNPECYSLMGKICHDNYDATH
jgi:hypothetical protein